MSKNLLKLNDFETFEKMRSLVNSKNIIKDFYSYKSWVKYFSISVKTITGISASDFTINNSWVHILVLFETVLGSFYWLVFTSKIVSHLIKAK